MQELRIGDIVDFSQLCKSLGIVYGGAEYVGVEINTLQSNKIELIEHYPLILKKRANGKYEVIKNFEKID